MFARGVWRQVENVKCLPRLEYLDLSDNLIEDINDGVCGVLGSHRERPCAAG